MLTDHDIDKMAGDYFVAWNHLTPHQWRTFARSIEQAIRVQTIEEAAQLCDHLWTRAGDADQCADAIRALTPPAHAAQPQ